MQETRIRFTKGVLEKLKSASPGRRDTYHDLTLQGLCLRVTDKGAKSFFVQKRINGRVTRTTLGRFPDMTVEIGRKEAQKVLGDISQGINPVEVKREKKAEAAAKAAEAAANTVDSATVRDVLAEYTRLAGIRASTSDFYTRALRAVCPDWLDKPLLSISPLMIRERHATYPSRSQANSAMRSLRALFNHQIDLNELDRRNPVVTALTGKGKANRWHKVKRRKSRVEDDQLAAWFDAVDALPGAGKRDTWAGDVARDLFKFQMFTGLRTTGECAALTWDQVDLKKGTVTYTQTKTTDESDDPVTIPLNSVALTLLRSRPKDGSYVFPQGDSFLKNPRPYVTVVRELTGTNWTPYDCRRTFLTHGEALRIPELTRHRLVNHVSQEHDVSAGYVGFDIESMRQASEEIAQRSLRLAGRGDTNVIDFKKEA